MTEFVLHRSDLARSLPHIAGGTRRAAAYQAVKRSLQLEDGYDSEQIEAMDLTLRFLAHRPDVRAALFEEEL